GNHDSAPRWSPDGKWLAFVRSPDTPAAPPATAGPGVRPPAPQLYIVPMTGGESWKITDLPRGAGTAVWSPDSRMMAFISTTSPEDMAKQQRGKGQKDEKSSDKDEKKDDQQSSRSEERRVGKECRCRWWTED